MFTLGLLPLLLLLLLLLPKPLVLLLFKLLHLMFKAWLLLLLLMLGMEQHVSCSSELPPSSLCFKLITLLPSPVESVVTILLFSHSLYPCPCSLSNSKRLPGDSSAGPFIDSPMPFLCFTTLTSLLETVQRWRRVENRFVQTGI